MRLMPSMKFGTVIPTRLSPVFADPMARLATGMLFITAVATTASATARPAISRVTRIRGTMASATLCLVTYERPKSPCSAFHIQLRYCSWTGRSNP